MDNKDLMLFERLTHSVDNLKESVDNLTDAFNNNGLKKEIIQEVKRNSTKLFLKILIAFGGTLAVFGYITKLIVG